jgi:hypothetical protein
MSDRAASPVQPLALTPLSHGLSAGRKVDECAALRAAEFGFALAARSVAPLRPHSPLKRGGFSITDDLKHPLPPDQP